MEQLHDHSERAHAILSASSAHRWLECPPSALAATKYTDTGSTYATEGTLAHEVAEWAAAGRDIEELDTRPDVTPEMIRHAEEYRDYLQEHFTDEPNRAFILETRVDFSPWVPDGFGTCDALMVQGTKMDIFDYKYGMGVPVYAENNPQMKLYALGALNDYGFMLDVDEVELHIFQPRINNISSWKTTSAELVEWAEKVVKPTAKLAYKGKGKYKPGEHCKFCPHGGRCRALTATCTDFIESHGIRQSVPVLAPFEVAEVLKMEPIISNWLRHVKATALNDMLDGKEVPGYKAVAGRLGNRKWKDEDEVITVLQEAGYGPEDYFETKLKAPAGIDNLLGKKKAAELLADSIIREEGSPCIAPESDKRPAVNSLDLARKEFND